ncbi:MAG: hypothetical protein ACR2PK_11425 [Acidimicrobiales bacterium]
MFATSHLVLTAMIMFTTTIGPTGFGSDSGDAPERSESAIVLIDADPRWSETISWAHSRFSASGLTPPSAGIHVHSGTDQMECHGHAGYFSVGSAGPRVDLCVPFLESALGTELRRKLVLHELAHAWDHENLDEATRQAFMDQRGMEGWNRQADDHNVRGIEHAANTIAYILMPDSLPDNVQSCGFTTLTGLPLPQNRIERCS